ncbi:MAG: hypothetical protein ACK52I_07200 [Pseudomonadota bacterium]|jgi:multidrug resistance efflux pump
MSTNLNSDGTTTTLMTASERFKALRAEIAQRDAEIERLRALLDTADEIARQCAERRERIATACLAGLLAHPSVEEGSDEMSVTAVRFADALIARLDAEAKP